ncbi:S-layer homology domain-containing protein [Paenibacillus alkaliterrae]|uniref:S-layer homology domain-containing protein n=1 Tax=Paenibacillus alkaliterrae TaxID=320909 RepID=UPI001F40F43B|nr:S-layer homology domain-containing protein [Paenibacillus alkaliterrae]MCF2940578.1 S-layer homology domain-containing protein [Paenibacillus alkaliterrae]
MFKKMISYVLVFTFFIGSVSMVGSTKGSAAATSSDVPFTDIQTHWAKDNIMKAKKSGLIDGFPDGTFRPDDVVKGDQFVSMMLRAFSDGNTKFDQAWLDSLITYQPGHLATILSAVKETNFTFNNARSGYWATPFIDILYDMEFLHSFDSVFPEKYDVYKKQITREKASYLIGRWFTNYEDDFDSAYKDYVVSKSGLVDMNSFSNTDVRQYRSVVLIAGLIRGWNNHFYPQRYVTRAEALTMIQRLRDSSLRDPYKPDLTGQHYIELDGKTYMFSDQYKLDTYKKIVELANKHVQKGYKAVGSLGVAVFDSKDTHDKRDFLIRFGEWDNLPLPEISVTVAEGSAKYIRMFFPNGETFANSKNFVDAAYELLTGSGKGVELKNKVVATVKNYSGKEMQFTLNNKKYKVVKVGDTFNVDYLY